MRVVCVCVWLDVRDSVGGIEWEWKVLNDWLCLWGFCEEVLWNVSLDNFDL